MEQIIMLIMAAGALLGGLDRLLGNRWGLGAKFEEGFQLLGSVALAQAGIICLAPVLSNVLGEGDIEYLACAHRILCVSLIEVATAK
jgi:ethanolamine transporter